MPDLESVAVILLAAGSSSRMGKPKQLLPVAGKGLLRHVVDSAVSSDCRPFIVVLGSDAALIQGSLEGADIEVIVNAGWIEGIGSSLRCGIKVLCELAPYSKGVIVALADNPNFSREIIAKLIGEQERGGRSIVASECGGVLAPPVYFGSRHYSELASSSGDDGAKALLKRHYNEVAVIRLDHMLDLDTEEDFAEYQKAGGDGGEILGGRDNSNVFDAQNT